METLASMWEHEHDPTDLCDLDESRNMLSSLWESKCAFTPSAGLMWTQQLSPHLQRNKQLQDALLQREEELARLQEENSKLRGFLSSSFVTNLQEKAKKLTADRRNLKRNQSSFDHEPSEVRGHPFSKQITKRVCRNLTAEFCSESSAGSASPEPSLDLWVLRMLGLKDQNTIDASSESESSLKDLVYCDAFGSPVSTPSSVHSYCQTAAGETDHLSSEGTFSARPVPTCSGPVGALPSSALTEICSTRGVQLLESSWTPNEQLCFTSRSSSGSVLNKSQAPSSGCSATSSQSLHKPTDLAFSMSLSPSSSVKTHSFPQGQAFIRKDTGGRWNFTWVPRQEP
ncbi:geminin coiled-coil domain-containing protein 1 isoform X1 [Poecilia latipinna]|uniref:geminin coiled-coil domain-containing protein 1 isoform X1 n=2 Tax=Poecilia latipinna TaxID=48699 RepID=UPI00072EC4B3|nr:PREDICTED: geminin coiled-coil domain-containing protein 1 isoform X1 [Poecilia latipinna]XP_014912711.1 PREDICTED: geminin coiled-coil domain-containing protein 1 isoform X1 [Poecilia latipinna]